jgi:hypothetical protein
MVGNGDAMGVTSQVVQNILRTAEGRLGVNDPILAEEGTNQSPEKLGITKGLLISVKSEFPLSEGALKAGHKLTPKHPAEDLPRQKVGRAGLNPARMIGGQSARRNHAVDMGVMLQVLSPGVKHAEKADVCAEVLGSGGNFQERRGAGLEEQPIEEALILIGEGCQLVGKGEDHMHVANGE